MSRLKGFIFLSFFQTRRNGGGVYRRKGLLWARISRISSFSPYIDAEEILFREKRLRQIPSHGFE